MGKRLPKSLLFLRGYSLCLFACIYIALAGQSSCSGTGTKTFGNVPGSNSSTTSSASNAVSSASFDGLVSVSSVDYRSVSLTYGKSVGAVSLNVYCTVGKNATTYTLAGSLPNILAAGGSGTISNLSSGTTHTCYALAVNAAGVETPLETSATPITVSFQTLSYLQNAYRNVAIVKAYGDTANPVTSPTSRMVSITWVPIVDLSLSAMTYRVYRTRKGVTPNLDATSSNTNCISDTAANTATCRVSCAAPGPGTTVFMGAPITCVDTAVATSPARYWYFVTLVPAASAGTLHFEEPPSTPSTLASATPAVGIDAYFVDVPIPPDEMVLVHRDSVNYEFCQLTNRASTDLAYIDGRATPTGSAVAGRGVLYDNRCLYGNSLNSAPGALPYNTNAFSQQLAFNAASDGKGYYDFGYNLFIDRWELGCNYTLSNLTATDAAVTPFVTKGGKCGPSQSDGDCFGKSAPSNTIGVDGNVYWDARDLPMCWVKDQGVWKATGFETIITPAYLQGSFSLRALNDVNNVGSHFIRPAAFFRTQSSAVLGCQSQAVGGYSNSKKRLLRRREFVAASAWPVQSLDQYNPDALNASSLNLRSRNAYSTNTVQGLYTTDMSGLGCHDPLAIYNTANNRNGYGNSFWGFGYYLSGVTSSLFNAMKSNPASNGYFTTGISNTTFFYNGGSKPGPFAIGSPWSSGCTSRYGAQDLIGNMGEWSSDQYTCTGTGASFSCAYVNRALNPHDQGADQFLTLDDFVAPKPSPTSGMGMVLTLGASQFDWQLDSGGWGIRNQGGNGLLRTFWNGPCRNGTLTGPGGSFIVGAYDAAGNPVGCGNNLDNFTLWRFGNASLPTSLTGMTPSLGFAAYTGNTPASGCDTTSGNCNADSSVTDGSRIRSADPQFYGYASDSKSSTLSPLAIINGGAFRGGLYDTTNGFSTNPNGRDLVAGVPFDIPPSRYNFFLYSSEGSTAPNRVTQNPYGWWYNNWQNMGVSIEPIIAPYTGARCAFSPD